MIGFELGINGKYVSAALKKGVVSIIATRILKDDEDSMNVKLSGLSTEDDDHRSINWIDAELMEDDELTIRVKRVDKNSEPIAIVNKNKKQVIERKLKAYIKLREELVKEGII